MLYSKKLNNFYLGYSANLKDRLKIHISGKNKSTKKANDWILAYYEAYLTEKTARKREASLKRSGKAYVSLKQRIRTSLDNLGEGKAVDRSPGKRRP